MDYFVDTLDRVIATYSKQKESYSEVKELTDFCDEMIEIGDPYLVRDGEDFDFFCDKAQNCTNEILMNRVLTELNIAYTMWVIEQDEDESDKDSEDEELALW